MNNDLFLNKISENKNPAHAYLIYSDNEIDKNKFAKQFAINLFCKNEKKPCLKCSSCVKIEKGVHPDFFEIKKYSDKTGLVIEQIRELKKNAYIVPNESDFKIYFIPDVGAMSQNVFNALLKILEEPPSHSVFLLTANSKNSIPQTIASRCIPVFLERKQQTEKQAIDEKKLEIVKAIAHAVVNGNEFELLCVFNKINENKQALIDVLKLYLLFLRDCLVSKFENSETSLNLTELEQEFVNRFTQKKLLNQMDFVSQSLNMLELNVNFELAVCYIAANLKEKAY